MYIYNKSGLLLEFTTIVPVPIVHTAPVKHAHEKDPFY